MKPFLHVCLILILCFSGCTSGDAPEAENGTDSASTGSTPAATSQDATAQGATSGQPGTPAGTPPAATVPVEPAGQAYTLRHHFQKGEVLRFHYTIEMNQQAANVDQEIYIENYNQWEIQDVLEDGSARATYSVNRVIYKLKMPLGRFSYDSDDAEEDFDSPLWAQMKPEVDFNRGVTFTCTISPLGKVSNLDVPDEVVELMKKNPGTASSEPAAFLAFYPSLTFAEFPEAEVRLGDTWKQVRVSDVFGGTMTSTKEFTLKEDPSSADSTTLVASGIDNSTVKFPEGTTFSMTFPPDQTDNFVFTVPDCRQLRRTTTGGRTMEFDANGVRMKTTATTQMTVERDTRSDSPGAGDASSTTIPGETP